MADRDADTGKVYPEGRGKRIAFLRRVRSDLIQDLNERDDTEAAAELRDVERELYLLNADGV